MTFTQEDKRDKIRSQLLFEFNNPKIPTKREDKSYTSLHKQPSKRSKFLANPKNLKLEDEKPL